MTKRPPPSGLLDVALDVLRPLPSEGIGDWAAREVFLDDRAAAVPGYYDPSLTPYAAVMFDFYRSLDYDELHIEKSSQVGITEAALCIVRWMPHHEPGPVLYAIDTREEAANIARSRLRSSVRAAGGKHLETGDFSTKRLDLGNMTVMLTGGASEAPFRNKFLKLGVLDEVENHKINWNPGESGTTIDQMRSRFTTVTGGKLISMSKTGLRGGIINKEVESGTLHKWFVPCPHCGRMQVLEDLGTDSEEGESGRRFPEQLRFGHLKDLAGEWDFDRFEREVFWECVGCNGEILWHTHLREMAMAGEARATNVGDLDTVPVEDRVWCRARRPVPRRQSLRINDFYSQFSNVCWGRLAQKFVEASKDVDRLKHLFTNHFTIAWEPKSSRVAEKGLLRLRSGLRGAEGVLVGPRYVIPLDSDERVCPVRDPVFVSYCADRQENEDKFSVCAWDENLDFWLFDYGAFLGDELHFDRMTMEYPVLGDPDGCVTPTVGLIDSGFRTVQTYELCIEALKRGIALYPSKGAPGVTGTVEKRTKNHGGWKLTRYDYSDHSLKRFFYLGRLDVGAKNRLWLPTDMHRHQRFLAEMMGERLVKDRDGMGYALQKWKQTGANDFGDTLKMHCACMLIVQPQALAIIEERKEKKEAAAKVDSEAVAEVG